ncbi:MAG TPA: GFA family protein [Myxococcota bacterium]|nr:GFA family protein [Myxococcota bacterium]
MRVDGSCHCGRITYEAEVDPAAVGVCHCTDCQMLTGSAYRVSVPAPAASFKLTGGPPKVYVKTADSGNKRAHAFCPDCGSPIYAAALADTPTYSLRVGALSQRVELPPRRRIWCSSALPWSLDLRGLPEREKQ